jgi:hypothetical protein
MERERFTWNAMNVTAMAISSAENVLDMVR